MLGRIGTANTVRIAVVVALITAVSASAVVFLGSETPVSHDAAAGKTTIPTDPQSTTTTEPPTTATTEAPPPETAPPDTAPSSRPANGSGSASAPAPPPPPPPPPPVSPGGLAGQLAGLSGKAWNNALGGAAANWASYLASSGQFVHQNLSTLIVQLGGFQTMGENLWIGPSTATANDVHAAWMASPPHAANLNNPAFTMIGVGCAVSGSMMVCVEDFGG